VPFSSEGVMSVEERYDSMPEGEARTAFYQKHRDELITFINKPSKK
jgi:hypothetical protein